MIYKGYEAVIGLEVHVELMTRSKIFCQCSTKFGAVPNTNVCPVCMGEAGSLPRLNEKAVELAVLAGGALHCNINEYSAFDRKSYFYPDLPKAYQITQQRYPICTGGYLDYEVDGQRHRVRIERIHMEEDAGKITYDADGAHIDHNRCGVPLIEIVTMPDMRCGTEVSAFLKALRSRLLFCRVSDCKMNEGSLRADINLSVRKAGDTDLGVRTEMKNLNSFKNCEDAVEYEFHRQVDSILSGEKIVQQTRRYDADKGVTLSMRDKSSEGGYRYFPESDILPLILKQEYVDSVLSKMPPTDTEIRKEYVSSFSIKESDAAFITETLSGAEFFERAAHSSHNAQLTANLIIGQVLGNFPPDTEIAIDAQKIAEISNMWSNNEINSTTAKKLTKKLCEGDFDVRGYVEENTLYQINDKGIILHYVREAIENNPKAIEDYKRGKKTVKKALLGYVMRAGGGNIDPQLLDQTLSEELRAFDV